MGKYSTSIVLLLLFMSVATILALDREENGAYTKIAPGGDPCYLPAESGVCYAYFENFYYDSQEDRCKSFVYGGCGGNANRFDTEQECAKFRFRCLRKFGRRNRRGF